MYVSLSLYIYIYTCVYIYIYSMLAAGGSFSVCWGPWTGQRCMFMCCVSCVRVCYIMFYALASICH